MFRFASYRGRARVLLASAGVLFITTTADADLQPGYAVGIGANTSSVIIDFAFDAGDAYLFEYRYDGSATAEDMLRALDGAGSLNIDFSVFDFGPPEAPDPQYFVNGFIFSGSNSVPDFGTTGSFWTYYLADEPVTDPATWTAPSFGPTGRSISDGSLDGWRVNISGFAPPELNLDATNDPPTDFSAATIAQVSGQLVVVPEPSSAALIVLASGILIRRRRTN